MPASNQSSLPHSAATKPLQTVPEAEPDGKALSMAAVTRPGNILSEDGNLLLILLSFLKASEKIHLDLLFRGATPRKRWNEHGEIEEVDARHACLAPELVNLLSDIQKLDDAFHELERSSTVLKDPDQTYTVNENVVDRVRGGIPQAKVSFWRCQALIVTYRAIPWKYIEST